MDASRRAFLCNWTVGGAALGLLTHATTASAAGQDGLIQWQTWQDGLQKAAAEKKGIGLLIYADWCPHCRELQPVFRDPETVKASQPIIMIRQNADESPPWLQERFGRLGTYVPRIFFLHPDGTHAAEIQSGNPKYPYFYQPHQGAVLRASMKQAATLGHKR